MSWPDVAGIDMTRTEYHVEVKLRFEEGPPLTVAASVASGDGLRSEAEAFADAFEQLARGIRRGPGAYEKPASRPDAPKRRRMNMRSRRKEKMRESATRGSAEKVEVARIK